MTACPRVKSRLSGCICDPLVVFQGFGCAEAPVGFTFSQELGGMLMVKGQSFRLSQSVPDASLTVTRGSLTCLYGPNGPFTSGPVKWC